MCIFYVSSTIRWCVTVEISLVRESIQGDDQTTAMFRTSPEIMADVSTYDPKELGSGWRFDSVQRLAISLCPFRPTIEAGSYIQKPKSLYSKVVLNIQNLEDDYCFVWRILGHIYRIDKHACQLYNYRKYFNELDISVSNTLAHPNFKP